MGPRRRVALGALAVLAGLSGCGPQKQAPVRVMALIQTNQGTFAPKEISLESIGDIVARSGTAAKFIGGAKIVLDFNDPLIQATGGDLTEEQIKQVFVKSAGSPPKAAYIEKDGVLWPTDFYTWDMVTMYYNFEQAFKYFQATRVDAQEIASPTVYYTPYFAFANGGGAEQQQKDNTLFCAPIKAFAILPWD